MTVNTKPTCKTQQSSGPKKAAPSMVANEQVCIHSKKPDSNDQLMMLIKQGDSLGETIAEYIGGNLYQLLIPEHSAKAILVRDNSADTPSLNDVYVTSIYERGASNVQDAFKIAGYETSDIPQNPENIYKEKWISLSDWIGSQNIAPQHRKYKAFDEAREFVRALHLTNDKKWRIYCKSVKKPNDIPINPAKVYKDKWKTLSDWLGSKNIAPNKMRFLPYQEASAFVQSLNLSNEDAWRDYCKSGNKPTNIPACPEQSYKNKGWTRWGDWLRAGKILNRRKKYRDFEDARAYARSLKLKNQIAWKKYSKTKNRPIDIPTAPWQVYKNTGWVSIKDWLGTNLKK